MFIHNSSKGMIILVKPYLASEIAFVYAEQDCGHF